MLYKILYISALLLFISCHSNEDRIDFVKEGYSLFDVIEKDSLIYFKDNNTLFSGLIVEKDSTGRIIKEMNFEKGRRHGAEIHYEYFESDLAVIVLEGNWTNGKKRGIWKSHDGQGQMTIVSDYK